jgi:hypothetical protein
VDLVFLRPEPMFPDPVFVDEVGIAYRGRAILAGDEDCHVCEGARRRIVHTHGLDGKGGGAGVRSPLVLGEPLLPGVGAPSLRVQVVVGVASVLRFDRLVVGFCRLSRLILGLRRLGLLGLAALRELAGVLLRAVFLRAILVL